MIPKDYVDQVISTFFDEAFDPRLVAVGCGGAGGNVVSALHDRRLPGVEVVAVNRDPSGLERVRAARKVLLPLPEGGVTVEGAAEAARGLRSELAEVLSADILFFVAGLGGSTGSGATPALVRAAKDAGAVTVVVAILPFVAEGRQAVAQDALDALRALADTVVVVDNESLLTVAPALGIREAFGLVDQMVIALVEGVLEHLGQAYLADVTAEVELAARELEAANEAALRVEITTSAVEAAPEVQPVAFDASGFIGFR